MFLQIKKQYRQINYWNLICKLFISKSFNKMPKISGIAFKTTSMKLSSRKNLSPQMMIEILEYIFKSRVFVYSYFPKIKNVNKLGLKPRIQVGKYGLVMNGIDYFKFLVEYYNWIYKTFASIGKYSSRWKLQSDNSIVSSVSDLSRFFNKIPVQIELSKFFGVSILPNIKLNNINFNSRYMIRRDRFIQLLVYSVFGFYIFNSKGNSKLFLGKKKLKRLKYKMSIVYNKFNG